MKTYYDEIANGYDELHFAEQTRKAELILKELKFVKGDTLLDVGCGTGAITSLFPCKVTGIDPSLELLRKAKIHVVLGVAEKLPFADMSFDVVISLTAIHNFSDFAKGISEMKRVAKRAVVITVLKKAKKFKEIKAEIERQLNVAKSIDDAQDAIFLCTL